MFLLFNFSSIFPGGQLTPFAPMCGRPWADTLLRTQHKLRKHLKVGGPDSQLKQTTSGAGHDFEGGRQKFASGASEQMVRPC